MLSRKNYNKLNEHGLYERPPTKKDEDMHHDVWWCKNWTFKCSKRDDGSAIMFDTYWGYDGNSIEVTDENIDEFKLIFDFRDVEKISADIADEYDPEDIYHVATDSGGMYCGGNYYKKIDAKPSIDLQIEKEEAAYRAAIRRAEYCKNRLNALYQKKGMVKGNE